jgi:phage shock protein PspC (stress-responsive transcriptional regulator)
LKFFFEKYGFHVSSRLADSLGMRVTSVRLFFIYVSFVTAGLWFGVYLTLAFWIKLKDLIRAKDLLYLICKTSINKKGTKKHHTFCPFFR